MLFLVSITVIKFFTFSVSFRYNFDQTESMRGSHNRSKLKPHYYFTASAHYELPVNI